MLPVHCPACHTGGSHTNQYAYLVFRPYGDMTVTLDPGQAAALADVAGGLVAALPVVYTTPVPEADPAGAPDPIEQLAAAGHNIVGLVMATAERVQRPAADPRANPHWTFHCGSPI